MLKSENNQHLVSDSSCAIQTPHLGIGEQRVATRVSGDGAGAKQMVKTNSTGITRRGLLGAFAATAVAAAPTYSNAAGFLRGAGDVRKISMFSGRTGERIETIYWIEGEYIGEALHEVNRFMRDWRTSQSINMDTRTIDIMSASLRLMDTDQPFMMLSGYRSPQTNAMLRSRNSGVARNSLHMKGQAADLRHLWPLPSEGSALSS